MNQRMYLAGYRGGARLAGLPFALKYNRRPVGIDERYSREYGLDDYQAGFEDGWHKRLQVVAGPLEQPEA